jgi:type VI secretion system secreted protein VgrG
MAYDQSKRLLKITTKLGADLVMLTELDGLDELSRPFLFRIKIVTEQPVDTVKGLLGTKVTLEFGNHGVPEALRPFHGHVRRLVRTAQLNADGTEWEWEAEVVPQLWFLSLRTNLRMFKDVTFKDIVTRLTGEHGITSPVMRATTFAQTMLDFWVQYRESDLDFLSRRMERFGWFYFHQHDQDASRLVVGDANMHGEEAISLGTYDLMSLAEDFSVQSGQWAHTEYDPNTHATTTQIRPSKILALQQWAERFDYPGAFIEKSGRSGELGLEAVGRQFTDVAMEREEARHHLRRASSANPHIDAGRRVTFSDIEALVTAVTHRARDYSHWTAADWGDQEPVSPFYVNDFTCIPQSVPFRPEASTRRPVVEGPQTATVTLGGDNPNVDLHGRVKLKFHWDREENTSTWVRVSQGWASNGFGQMHLPRTGDEVIVEFLEGDPDRPIVTGRVYNGKNKVPFGVQGTHMQSGIRTSANNQLRFDDTSGKEEVYIRAASTLLTEVVDDETHKVEKGDRVTEIAKNDKLTIKQGNLTIKADAGSVEIEAANQIVLKVGSNKITVSQSGVAIEGVKVDMKGQASANVESTGTTTIKGSMIMIG